MSYSAGVIRAAENLLTNYMCARPGEEVLITSDTLSDPRVSAALLEVGEKIGARVTISLASPLPYQGQLSDPYIPRAQAEATRNCDVWIDLCFPYFAGSHVHDEAMQTKQVRYLLGGDMNAGSFERLFGAVDLDQYFEAMMAFDEMFTAAEGKMCRITTPLGSDVRFKIGKSGLKKPRYAKEPGMFLVPGTCSIAPDVPTVQGKMVVTNGFHEFYEYLQSPVTLIVDGKIKQISGGGPSRVPLERAVLRAGGGEYGSIIHFSHGLHPATRMTGTSFIEDIRTMGSNAVGLGIPWWEPGGGENHPDVVMAEHSVWIEDEQIIRDGVIVTPSALAAKAAALTPVWAKQPKRS